MVDYEHLGGVGEVSYYMKSEFPSPCLQCPGFPVDKKGCVDNCIQLTKWQIECGAVAARVKHKDVKKMGKSGERLCGECRGKLRYEDGVIYCVECWEVHMRLKGKETGDRVRYLLKKGWGIEEIAQVFGMDQGYIMVVGRRLGYSFPVVIDKGDKIAVVDYALMEGSKKAGKKFGLHYETVNRYCRELGFGVKERYERLKVEAARLYKKRVSVREVAKKLGVNWRTAKRWKKG
jgi:hypothetical protein